MEMSYEEMFKLMIEDADRAQKWRAENPCCANCKYYYEDVGCDCCHYWGDVGEDTDIYKDKCGEWR